MFTTYRGLYSLIYLLILCFTQKIHAHTKTTHIQTLIGYPYSTSAIDYQNTTRGSFSYQKIQYYPMVIFNTYPYAQWLFVKNNIIPNHAIIVYYLNGFPQYYCRIFLNNQYQLGQLSRKNGCVIFNNPQIRPQQYEVLVKY